MFYKMKRIVSNQNQYKIWVIYKQIKGRCKIKCWIFLF